MDDGTQACDHHGSSYRRRSGYGRKLPLRRGRGGVALALALSVAAAASTGVVSLLNGSAFASLDGCIGGRVWRKMDNRRPRLATKGRSSSAYGGNVAKLVGVTRIAREAGPEVDFESMTVAELKALCKERGLPISGRKAVLIERLRDPESQEQHERNDEKDEKKEKEKKEEKEEPQPPFGSRLPDPHEGKPEVIMDDEGRKRYLCLDGQYRRGDPDSIECKDENFSKWLTEWVVAARTGQLEGQEQKTFFPKEPDKPGNPKGIGGPGIEMKSEEVLRKLPPGKDKKARWEYNGESWDKYEFEGQDHDIEVS